MKKKKIFPNKKEKKILLYMLTVSRFSKDILKDFSKALLRANEKQDRMILEDCIWDWEATVELEFIPGVFERASRLKKFKSCMKKLPEGFSLSESIFKD